MVTTEMGLSEEHYDEERKQYISERILGTAAILGNRYQSKGSKVPLIVIIPGDMNSEDNWLRFIFSQHDFKNHITVVSLARINPVSYGKSAKDALMIKRLEKLVNKGLGYHL